MHYRVTFITIVVGVKAAAAKAGHLNTVVAARVAVTKTLNYSLHLTRGANNY